MSDPADILDAAFQRATINLNHSLVADSRIRDNVEYVAGNVANKAGVRLLMACLLAKIHNPVSYTHLDVYKRQPLPTVNVKNQIHLQ